MSAFAARRNAAEIAKVRSYVLQYQANAFQPTLHKALLQLRATLHDTLARRSKVQSMRHMTCDRRVAVQHDSIDRTPQQRNFSFSHTPRECENTAAQCHLVSDTPRDINYRHADDDYMDDDTRGTYDRLCAAKTKPNKKHGPARQGAKRAKAMERLTNAEGALDPEQATGYRALSARGNYLSQDRADISHSTKELCRDFLCQITKVIPS